MSLANPKYQYTHDQINALELLDKFFQSDCNCFILKGYAGTGKTFLIKSIAEYLNSKRYECKLMAPTGRAAMILKEKTGIYATTIHRAIYNLDEIIETDSDDKKSFKFKYGLKKIETNTRSIYIVDEASMVSDTYSENDFFIYGSGLLLNDLLSHMALNNVGRSNKIIFVGDPAQLPPVTDNISPALSQRYLKDNYQLDSQGHELTEIVRQKADSGVLHIASYLRKELANPKRNSFRIDTQKPDVEIIDASTIVDRYIESNKDKVLNKSIIVNHSNRKAYDYNIAIREALFKDKNSVEEGDILIIHYNNYNYDIELFNGTLVKVKKVSPDVKIQSMKSYDENGKDVLVNHVFREIVIEVPYENSFREVECLILDNYLQNPEANLTYAESIALYIDFKIRNPYLKPGTADFRNALKDDPFFNALKVKYGYAVTCHKAQGGEWDSVFVNMDVHMGLLSPHFLRWVYTAVTRSKNKLFLYNVPETSQFSKLHFNFQLLQSNPQSKSESTASSVITFNIPDGFEATLEKFGLANAKPFQRNKFIEISAKSLDRGYHIISRTSHNFQDVYLFEHNGKKAGIVFWYNSKDEYTKQTISSHLTESNDLAQVISTVMATPITIDVISQDVSKESFMEFNEVHRELRVLYDYLNTNLIEHKIQIKDIKHLQYQEVYYFKRRQEKAAIRFYYDGKHRFKTGEPILNDCNSNSLLEDIYKSIEGLITES